jgi:uridine phosphorylase
MVDEHDELIPCRRSRKDPRLGPFAVMVAMKRDFDLIQQGWNGKSRSVGRLFSSQVMRMREDGLDVGIVGPVLGAPHAVMVLEKLGAIGVRRVVFLGWCGAVSSGIRIGDMVIPDSGVIGEGTSGYYLQDEVSLPSRSLTDLIETSAGGIGHPVHKGPVWSTDAPYRETRDRILSLQAEGVLAVDMEISALFSAGRFRGIAVGALLVVSDELDSLTWIPGFSTDRFNKARKIAVKIVERTCRDMM